MRNFKTYVNMLPGPLIATGTVAFVIAIAFAVIGAFTTPRSGLTVGSFGSSGVHEPEVIVTVLSTGAVQFGIPTTGEFETWNVVVIVGLGPFGPSCVNVMSLHGPAGVAMAMGAGATTGECTL